VSVTQSLISIVLAIYKPNEVFLRKQLKSLNEQIYPNIELIICDDSENQGNDFLCSMIRKTITNFEWRLYKNKKNIGSNKTFELLTKMAKGEYIAYCDQDDIWEKNKLTALYDNIIKHESVLSYSDLCVIDENDTITYKSLRKLVPRLKHVQGDLLYQYFIKRNSITGCTLLVKSSIAKEAVPFLNGFVHDHWIALYASIMGSISYVPEALIRYRIHGNNQIGTKRLDEICSKVDYLKKRLYRRRDSIIEILNRLNN
jgi:GT2 family glycosyltransferase